MFNPLICPDDLQSILEQNGELSDQSISTLDAIEDDLIKDNLRSFEKLRELTTSIPAHERNLRWLETYTIGCMAILAKEEYSACSCEMKGSPDAPAYCGAAQHESLPARFHTHTTR